MSTCTLSRRGSEAPASPIRALAGIARDAVDRGITVHGLNIGQPDIPTPPQMLQAYRDFHDEVLAYAPSEVMDRKGDGSNTRKATGRVLYSSPGHRCWLDAVAHQPDHIGYQEMTTHDCSTLQYARTCVHDVSDYKRAGSIDPKQRLARRHVAGS